MLAYLSLCGHRRNAPHPPSPTLVVADAQAGLRDPTQTSRLRARLGAEADRRWQLFARTLRQALIQHDLVGLRGISRLPHVNKTEGLAAWIRAELDQKVFGGGFWLKPYVQEAARRAHVRAEQQAPGGQVDPHRISHIEALAASELKGIVEAAQQQIVRFATASMMTGHSPTKMANKLAGVIRVMRHRTRAMGEDIIAKAHATATLSAYRSAGVTHVGIIPEYEKGHGPRVRMGDARRPRDDEDEDEDEVGEIDLPSLVEQSKEYWRERAAKLTREKGATRAVAQVEREMAKEEARLEKVTSSFRERLQKETEEYVERQKALGEAERARAAAVREDIFQQAARMIGYTGRLSREQGPSPAQIGAIERAQRRLEETLGGGLVNVVTAGDDLVCEECDDIADRGPYTLEEAEGLIPAHPRCRCAFEPAESESGEKEAEGEDEEDIGDAWSEEAREAAAEARRAKAKGKKEKQGAGGGVQAEFEHGKGYVRAFHGTVSSVLDKIKSDGLKVMKDDRTWGGEHYKGERGESVYVANSLSQAWEWAYKSTTRGEMEEPRAGHPVVVELHIPKKEWGKFKQDEMHETSARTTQAIKPSWVHGHYLHTAKGDLVKDEYFGPHEPVVKYMVIFVKDPTDGSP